MAALTRSKRPTIKRRPTLEPTSLGTLHADGQYRLLFEFNPNPMCVIDEKTLRFLAVNKAMVKQYGWARPALLRMTAKAICLPKDLPRLRAMLKTQHGSTMAFGGQWQHRRKDGSVFDVEINISTINFGAHPAFLVLVNDITARQQAEAALRESEQRYRMVADFTYDWEYWVDPTGRLIYVSPSCARITGYDPAAFAADPGLMRRLVHPADRARYDAHLLDGPGHHRRGLEEWRIRRRDGSYCWIGHVCQPVFDSTGKFLGSRGSNRDITVRKQAQEALQQAHKQLEQRILERTADLRASQEALRESEARFRQMAENVQEVFWLANSNLSKMLYVSTAYEKIWGLPCAALYKDPRAWVKAIHPEDRQRVHTAFFKNRMSQRPLEAEYRIIRPDGQVRWIHDHGSPICDQRGRVYRVAGVARDITEQKRLQAEVEHVQEMERQRLGRDLHDGLSQHLVAMSLLGNSLENDLRTKHPPSARAAGALAEHARNAVAMTRDLSRSLYPSSLHLSGLPTALRELAFMVQSLFPIQCQFEGEEIKRLADENLERQVFRIAQEAAFNAAKKSQGKHIWIALRTSNHGLKLTVKDDGIGVSITELSNGDMGLNIMRYRANLIGAMLTFDAQRGRGTTVTCQLRRVAS